MHTLDYRTRPTPPTPKNLKKTRRRMLTLATVVLLIILAIATFLAAWPHILAEYPEKWYPGREPKGYQPKNY